MCQIGHVFINMFIPSNTSLNNQNSVYFLYKYTTTPLTLLNLYNFAFLFFIFLIERPIFAQSKVLKLLFDSYCKPTKFYVF